MANIGINLVGVFYILREGFEAPTITGDMREINIALIPVFAMGITNGVTIITGVEVGYSSINIPHHKGKAIRISMALLFGIVSVTYILQIINFTGLDITYDSHQIEGMYGLAVVLAMNITIFSFLTRQVRVGRFSLLTWITFIVMHAMIWNILYNKFFEGKIPFRGICPIGSNLFPYRQNRIRSRLLPDTFVRDGPIACT